MVSRASFRRGRKCACPGESTGINGIARTLISAFDQADIVALGEAHGRRLDSELRIAVVRHPDFAKNVRSIVVEFGSTTEQLTLDRYLRGEDVPAAELERVWKATAQFRFSNSSISPIYPEFLAAVRDVNSKLPADGRIRVFGGDPGPGDNRSRDAVAVSVLKEQVLQKHGKALVIYGAGHFWRTSSDFRSAAGDDVGIATALEAEYPGRPTLIRKRSQLNRGRRHSRVWLKKAFLHFAIDFNPPPRTSPTEKNIRAFVIKDSTKQLLRRVRTRMSVRDAS